MRREHARASHEAAVLATLLSGPSDWWSHQVESAAAAAASAQQARVEAANALPSPVRKLRPGDDLWSQHGGPAIEELLDDLDLVDARWLVDLAEGGGVVPRWQEVPHSARIGKRDVWRLRFAWRESDCLACLVLSYAWLDPHHPDKYGQQLRRVCPILKAMLAAVASQHGTIGVMWDFCSLPQPPRSASHADRFTRGLRKMNAWYMHPFTHVLQLASALPGGTDADPYANARLWENRGWCV